MSELIVKWKDTKTEAEGYLVLDRIINGVSGGGIFMHSQATLEETADIARNMTKKFTVTVPQIGGAKAGIRFNHTDSRAKQVLRRFIQAQAKFLETVWVTAGDLNTDDAFIEEIITKELGLTCCQHRLAVAVAEAKNQPNLSSQLSKLIKYPANKYSPLIEATVGYGVSESIKTIVEKVSPELMETVRVMIQGFGAVGSNLGYYLVTRKIGKVVGICDKDGFICHPDGLPIIELLEARYNRLVILNKELNEIKDNLVRGSDGINIDQDIINQISSLEMKINEAKKNCIVNLSLSQKEQLNFSSRAGFKSNDDFMGGFLASQKAEVFSACAVRYVINEHTVGHLTNNMWKDIKFKYLICGANNPYGKYDGDKLIEDKMGQVQSRLQMEGVIIVPDWVTNSGTAQLFHRGLSIPFDLESPDLADQVLIKCAQPIRHFLEDVMTNPINIPVACLTKAERQIKNPIKLDVEDISIINPAKSIYALEPMATLPSSEERYNQVIKVGAECIQIKELQNLLENSPNPVCYDGFEPSGRMHIAQGLMKANTVNIMTANGFTYIFWVADIFAKLNHKMGGDLQKIRDVGNYFIEIWKACGMKMDRVKFLWAMDEINKRSDEYWSMVAHINEMITIKRVKRCMQIQGRAENNFEDQTASSILYSTMQCADIFFLGVDVCQLGLDQRKVNMLAREVSSKLGRKSPIILSHPMLAGLKEGQDKMSKSDLNSAIFMEDSKEEVHKKIMKAYCPDKSSENNPCLDYYKLIVFPRLNSVQIEIESNCYTYSTYEDLVSDYKQGKIFPKYLKFGLIKYLNQFLEPIRTHFEIDPYAKALLERVKTYKVTK